MTTRSYWTLALLAGAAGLASGHACPAAETAPAAQEKRVILTPRRGPEPRINGPAAYGCRPGRPLLYRIPTQGERPMRFEAVGLPPSLKLDATRGIVTGRAPQARGEYVVTLHARNDHGEDQRRLKIVVGEKLALAPPMGWNHWYTWYHMITAEKMKQAADQMVASGMADAGYEYVNIDDCWMRMSPKWYEEAGDRLPNLDVEAVVGPTRDADGEILPNKNFRDMKGLTDYIHRKGLKAGIYTSPGPWTCQRYEGSYQHERQDAERYAEWGFDFLKYDWCGYSSIAKGWTREKAVRPYAEMGAILETLDRDVVFNLCQYGREQVWEWGADVGGNCWRTTGDLGWRKAERLPGFYYIGFSNMEHWQYARCGEWNDPDYILIGHVGSPRRRGQLPQLTTLTGNEQYTYMSMWCLMAAPLIFSGDMAQLDEFTLNVLCNTEVIEVDQDPLGKQARPLRHTEEELVLAKPMEDGSLSAGLFNLSEAPRKLSVSWQQLGIRGRQRVRDLWRQKDLGTLDGSLSVEVPRHGVMMVRLWPAAAESKK